MQRFKENHRNLYLRTLKDTIRNLSLKEYQEILKHHNHPRSRDIRSKFKNYKNRLIHIKKKIGSKPVAINNESYHHYFGKMSFSDNRPYIKPINMYYIEGDKNHGRHDEIWIENKTDRIVQIEKLILKDDKKNPSITILKTILTGLNIRPQKNVNNFIKIKISPKLLLKYKKLKKLIINVSYDKK